MFLTDTEKDDGYPVYNNGLEDIEFVFHLMSEVDNRNRVCKVLLFLSWLFHYRILHQYNLGIRVLSGDLLLGCKYQLDNRLACQHLHKRQNE